MTRCPWCGGTGFLNILATRDHAPWDAEWEDADYWTPCHACPAGREYAGIEVGANHVA